jgi:predicted RNase H-like HicB family nuclease
MKYQAEVELTEGWWIGRLVDLPGVNAQERTFEELLESLRIGAEDLLDVKGLSDPNVEILPPPISITRFASDDPTGQNREFQVR